MPKRNEDTIEICSGISQLLHEWSQRQSTSQKKPQKIVN